MKRQTPQATIYEVYNTASADVHIGTYPVLAAHLHRCTQAAYPLALSITIKATKEEK